MRERGVAAADVRESLRLARARDTPFASGRVLGSMCTAPHPIAVEAYHTFLETNLGDPQLCTGAAELESKALASLGTLLHAPSTARGIFLTGGSEANLMGILLAHRRKGGHEVILPESAHFSFDKALSYLGLRPVSARVHREGTLDIDDVRARIGRETCCLVGIAGSTELGVVDAIPELAALGLEKNIPVHVDAAFGGFVIPFAKRLGRTLPNFDLAVPGVSTLAIDPHKMGMAPIPSGVLFARDARDFDAVSIPSPYVSIERQPSIQGTRPGAAPAAVWAVMEHLGMEGYTEIVRRCFETTRTLAEGLAKLGFRPVIDPVLNIVVFRVDDPIAARAALRKKGYLLSLAPLSKGLKVVVMPHVTDAAVAAFLDVLPKTISPPGEP